MDPIFILIVIVLLVAVGAFVTVLRGSSGGRARPVPTASATPAPVQQAVTPPTPSPAAPASIPTAGAPAVPEAAPASPDRDDVSPAAAVAELAAPDAPAEHDAEAAPPALEPRSETITLPPLPQQPPAADGAGEGLVSPLAAVSQPPTRSGEIRLQVAPQRLPFRFAELVGEQRQLEEAITLLHRRIDDVELDVDPSSYENRVRLGVLRQELAQRQERLREILFLQDGYRWLQQHMALDRAPDEAPAG